MSETVMIYDASEDIHRPVTQADVDALTATAREFARFRDDMRLMLKESGERLRALYEKPV